MKTLNLEQMGVQEMDAVEVKEVDGGMPWWAHLAWYMAQNMPDEPGANGYMGSKI